jgi:hypothetical protein
VQFKLTIDMDNAAFHDDPEELTTRLLDVAQKVLQCQASPGTRTVLDTNGNSVGWWSIDAR